MLLAILFNPFYLMINIFNYVGFSRLSGFMRIYLDSSDYGYSMKVYDPRILLNLGVVYLIYKSHKVLAYNVGYYKVFIGGVIVDIFR